MQRRKNSNAEKAVFSVAAVGPVSLDLPEHTLAPILS